MLSASISTRACSREHALLVKQPLRSNGVWATLQTCRLLMRLSTVSFANMACNSFLTKPRRFPKCIECWPIEVGWLSASGVQSSIARGKRRSLMHLSVRWGENRLRKSGQHSALVTLTNCNRSLLLRDFEASKFESNARPFDTHQWLNMCQAIFQQHLSQQQLLAWTRRHKQRLSPTSEMHLPPTALAMASLHQSKLMWQ